MVFHWSFSDSKSPQVSWILFTILADLNNAVVWMVSTCPIISKSFNFFSFLARPRYLFFFLLSFNFTLWSAWTAKSTIRQVLFFSLTRSGSLAKISWSVCISKSQRTLCVSFSRKDSVLCIYHIFLWSNLNFLHNSQWISFPTQSCLVLLL